jgi:hypothetical protein
VFKNIKIKIYKTVIIPVVLCGRKTLLHSLREEYGLRVLENRMLRRVFGPNKEEIRGWRKLHNEELYNLYSSPKFITVIKSRRIRWAGM